MPKIYPMIIQQLIDRGWSVINHSETSRPTAGVTTISEWKDLTWAQQTYYQGKYRFNESGMLEISLSELSNTVEKTNRHFICEPFLDKYVASSGAMSGSNERLREILERGRVKLECRSYDDSALVHIGPDGTAIYTNKAGWGPPLHWPEEKIYVELDDSRTCHWEIGPSWTSEAPCWTCPECNGF